MASRLLLLVLYWQHLPLPIVRRLLGEVKRIKDEHRRLDRVFVEIQSFVSAVAARSGIVGDTQLQTYWNRLKGFVEEEQEKGLPSKGVVGDRNHARGRPGVISPGGFALGTADRLIASSA